MIRFARTAFAAAFACLLLAAAVPVAAQDGIGAPRGLTATAICNALGRCPATLPVDGTQITGLQLDTITTLKAWTGRPAVVIVSGFGTSNDGGGGTFIWAAGDSTASDGCTVFQPTSGGASGRYKRLYSGAVDARWCGAKGDGSTNDGAALALAVAAPPVGGVVYLPPTASCYRITAPLVVSRALTLHGRNSEICQATANTAGLSVTASNVKIDGLKLTGPSPSTFQTGSIALAVSGTFNAGLAPVYISKVTVTNTSIDRWNGYGIVASYVDQFEASNNRVTNVVYGGIVVLSGTNGRIASNTVDTINCSGTPGGNCYGITLTRRTDDSGELVSQPRTSDYAVTGNTVRNVPTWEALDTHAGQRIAFTGNTISGTKSGIMVGTANNASSVETYAPLLITVAGNTMDSGVTDGSASYGIVLQGADGVEYATGSISGNTIKGYGSQSASASGAIYVRNTAGASITGNFVVNAAPQGIVFYHDNVGFSATGNSIVDPWTNIVGVGQAIGIDVNAENNTGFIGGNAFSTNGFSATYLLSSAGGAAIRIEDVSGTAIQLGPNRSTATIYVYDQGARASTALLKTSVTAITSGLWNGTKVAQAYGGTNADLSATGGASQVLRQSSSGAAITVSQLAASDLSNGTSGSGAVCLATSCALVTPALGTPSALNLANATNLPATSLSGTTLASSVVSSSLTSAAGGAFGSNAFNSTAYLPLGGGTLSGTLTAADGSTWSSTGINHPSASLLQWNSDTVLQRDAAAGVLALPMVGAALQQFFIYKSGSNAGTYQRLQIGNNGIFTNWSSSGYVFAFGSGTTQWQVSTAGTLTMSGNFSDNTGYLDLGVGAARSLTGSNASTAVNVAQTWNTSGNPTLIKANVTRTAVGSNTTASLIDLQVGGGSIFRVDTTGVVYSNTTAGVTCSGAPSGSFASTNGIVTHC